MESVETASYLLQHTASIMGRQSDQVLLERLGIGTSQFRILTMLQHEPNIQQRKLADFLGQTEASVSRQIKIMKEKGFLSVAVNPKSKRERITVLTPKGQKMAEAGKEVLAVYYDPIIALVNDKQRGQLLEALAAFHAHVCAEGKQYACDHPYKI